MRISPVGAGFPQRRHTYAIERNRIAQARPVRGKLHATDNTCSGEYLAGIFAIMIGTKRSPDLLIPGEWAIEVKIARPYGDNDREAENWLSQPTASLPGKRQYDRRLP